MSEPIDDGGPAFPAKHYDLGDSEHGMSLRDWFAGQALMGILAKSDSGEDMSAEAKDSFRYADFMLKARKS